MSRLNTIIADIKELKVVELAQLVEQLEKEFGVSASSMAAAAPTAQVNQPQAEAKTIFKVTLKEAPEKTKAIKALRVIKPGMGLIEAKNMVEALPCVILENASKDEAEAAKKAFEEAGAKIEIS